MHITKTKFFLTFNTVFAMSACDGALENDGFEYRVGASEIDTMSESGDEQTPAEELEGEMGMAVQPGEEGTGPEPGTAVRVPQEMSASNPSDPAKDASTAPVADDMPLWQPPNPQESSPNCGGINQSTNLISCRWEKAETTASSQVRVDCDNYSPGAYVTMGGCFTSSTAELIYNTPDEGSHGNMPEDGDTYHEDSGDGWSCGYNAAPGGSAAHRAVALCCFDFAAAACV